MLPTKSLFLLNQILVAKIMLLVIIVICFYYVNMQCSILSQYNFKDSQLFNLSCFKILSRHEAEVLIVFFSIL